MVAGRIHPGRFIVLCPVADVFQEADLAQPCAAVRSIPVLVEFGKLLDLAATWACLRTSSHAAGDPFGDAPAHAAPAEGRPTIAAVSETPVLPLPVMSEAFERQYQFTSTAVLGQRLHRAIPPSINSSTNLDLQEGNFPPDARKVRHKTLTDRFYSLLDRMTTICDEPSVRPNNRST